MADIIAEPAIPRKAPKSPYLFLAAILFLHAGCRQEDPYYAPNRSLIRLMDGHEKRAGSIRDKYVVPGDEGQYFYLEDLRAAVIKWANADRNALSIQGISQGLRAAGIRFLVVPVPTKAEVYPELLGGRNVFDLSPSKNAFLLKLDSLGIDYLDLRRTFFEVKNHMRLFPRTDTHWNQDAICLAAEKIAAELRLQAGSDPAPLFADTLLTGFKGDLADKFGVPETDSIRLKVVGNGDRGKYSEPDSAEILLFGDSFLTQFKSRSAHLGAHLARQTGRPVKTIYSLTGFTQSPKKIREAAAAFPHTKVIVWVFTSRSLMESILQE